MTRKTAFVTVAAPGRDAGKTFVLTEKSAMRTEKWAQRALLLALQSGADVEGNLQMGFAGVAVMGIQSLLGGVKFADLEPLLDEMFECVQIRPDPNNPQVVRGLIEEDIEEVETLVFLRQEIFALHAGFSFADALSKLKQGAPAEKQPDSPGTSTSPLP